MRAVLIATGYPEGMGTLMCSYRPTPLLRIADKPVIFYIMEFLVKHKITKCDLVLNHLPQMIETRLGDGERWGLQITYHLARDAAQPFAVLRPAVQGWKEDTVLFGMGDCLPSFGPEDFAQGAPTLFYYPDKAWSGWSILPTKALEGIPSKTPLAEMPRFLAAESRAASVKPSLSTRSLEDLKKSNLMIIAQKNPQYLLPPTARMVESAVWLSRAVSLHPTAKVLPPVFIGQNCQIKSGAVIGPNAVIENNCIIDSRSVIQDAIVCYRSYVGEGLEIRNCIVDRNLLINLALNTNVTIHDDFILGDMSPPKFKLFPIMLLERLLAAISLLLFFPVYLYLKKNHGIHLDPMLQLPASNDRYTWKTFNWMTFGENPKKKPGAMQRYFRRLPTLWNIIKGEAHFVGVSPRSITDVENLPPDWQKLYLKSKVGLITLSDLDNTPDPTIDDLYASEVFYSVHMGFLYDLKLLFRWLVKKIKSIGSAWNSTVAQQIKEKERLSDSNNSSNII